MTGPDGSPIPGSLSEKLRIDVGGSRQGMFIRSADPSNPVVLFLHGGPGMPECFLEDRYPTGLERRFTLCLWEQRGAGLSYDPGLSPESVTIEVAVEDALAVADYLRKRFGQERIILMAHSAGTCVGLRAAAASPERFLAYVAIAQIVDQPRSERLAFSYMRERYEEAGKAMRLSQLAKYGKLETDTEYDAYLSSLLRDLAMHELGIGTMRDMRSLLSGVVLPMLRCRRYTIAEKLDTWRGKALLRESPLRRYTFHADVGKDLPALAIPAYFASGARDYTVSYDLAKRYCASLQAPTKAFYTFAESAHSPLFEEPERFMRVMTEDVLRGRTDLADKD